MILLLEWILFGGAGANYSARKGVSIDRARARNGGGAALYNPSVREKP